MPWWRMTSPAGIAMGAIGDLMQQSRSTMVFRPAGEFRIIRSTPAGCWACVSMARKKTLLSSYGPYSCFMVAESLPHDC